MRRFCSERLDNWLALIIGIGATIFVSLQVAEGVTTGRYLFQNRFMTTPIEILWSGTPLLFAGFITVQIGLALLLLEMAWFGLYHIVRKIPRFSGLPIRYMPKLFGGVVVGVGILVALAEYAL